MKNLEPDVWKDKSEVKQEQTFSLATLVNISIKQREEKKRLLEAKAIELPPAEEKP